MTTRVWLHVDLPKDEPAALQKEFPDVEFVVGAALPQDALQGVEAIFLTKMPDDDVVEQMPKLRWLHGTMGGARGMLTPAVSQRPIMVSASKGTSASSMSEFALACLFTLKKRVLTCRQLQHEGQAKEIASLRPDILEGSLVGVIGLGGIGSAVARKCDALGMRVVATKLHVGERPAYVQELHTPDYFATLAERADALVFCAPPTALTKGILSEEHLRRMKPSCVIINLVTRNAQSDDVAIVKALKENRIAGAAFSVFGGTTAPPAESELWRMPNVILCPGMAAYDPRKWQHLRALFSENLRRFLTGDELLNLADPAAGY